MASLDMAEYALGGAAFRQMFRLADERMYARKRELVSMGAAARD